MKHIGLWTMVAAVALGGCADEGNVNDIDTYIRGLGVLPVEEPRVNEGQKSAPAREGDYSCTVQDFSETRRYDKLVAFAANSESMWPGAILRGDSLYDGLFTQTVFDRKPLAVSVSLENLAGARSATMEAPSLSVFRESIGKILSADVTGDTPANIYADIEEVHSEEQLALALGAGLSWGPAFDIKTSFNFTDSNKRSRYVVKYVQAYYTVDVDQPGRPSDFLADSVTLADIESTFGSDNPPVYVSSVTYGRTVVFTFESDYSAIELGSALEFVYSGGVDVSGDVSVTYRDVITQSRITAYILGGSGGDAAQSIDGYEALKEFLRSGGNYSRESPGAPIAYKLAYLADNAPARLSFTEDYQVKDCARVSQKVRVTVDSITVEEANDTGTDLELYGTISATAENQIELFNRNASQYLTIPEGQSYSVPNGYIGEGILQVNPQPGSVIRLNVHLREVDDLLNGDDDYGLIPFEASFETGWRRSVPVLLTKEGDRVLVTISMTPI